MRLSALGDICMTLPVLDSVSRAYPDVHFTLLTTKVGAIVMQTLLHRTNLDVKVIKKGDYKGISGLNRLYRELKELKFDAVADLHDVLRTQWVDLRFWLSGTPVRRIQKGRNDKKALTKGTIHRQLKTSIERYRQVFADLGMDFEIDYQGATHAALLREKPCAVPNDSLSIGIAPFAQHQGKVYPVPLMRQMISLLIQEMQECRNAEAYALILREGQSLIRRLSLFTEHDLLQIHRDPLIMSGFPNHSLDIRLLRQIDDRDRYRIKPGLDCCRPAMMSVQDHISVRRDLLNNDRLLGSIRLQALISRDHLYIFGDDLSVRSDIRKTEFILGIWMQLPG